MAINLADGPDLDNRVEKPVSRLWLREQGLWTAVIEQALAVLEERVMVAIPFEGDSDLFGFRASSSSLNGYSTLSVEDWLMRRPANTRQAIP